MRGMNSHSVDLIYLDPPFNSKTNYAAPIGSKAAGAAFKDTWTLSDVDAEWINLIEAKHPALYRVLLAAMTDSDKSYLAYMAARLIEMRRLLKPSGSVYLHCDPTMSHYLKLVMDAIFGRKAFRNEIAWHYGQRTAFLKNHFCRKHDTILFYARGRSAVLNPIATQWKRDEFLASRHDVKTDDSGREFIWTDGGPRSGRYKRYVADVLRTGKPIDDVWNIPILNSSAKERVGLPDAKAACPIEAYRERIQRSGDVILDPFCGCATACIAAEQRGREWIGIDISPKAAELVQSRMESELGLFYQGAHRTDIPLRTDLGKLIPYNDAKNKRRLYGEQGGRDCAGCYTHFEIRNLEADHIIPRAKGGTDHLENLQLLCGHCNPRQRASRDGVSSHEIAASRIA